MIEAQVENGGLVPRSPHWKNPKKLGTSGPSALKLRTATPSAGGVQSEKFGHLKKLMATSDMAITKAGYRVVWKPGHPNAWNNHRMFEHRFVMAEALGRPLKAGEEIHHINHNKLDNRIGNLQLLSSRGDHRRLHKKPDSKRRQCKICGKPERCLELCKSHYAQMRYRTGKAKRIFYEVTCLCCGKWIQKQPTQPDPLCRKCAYSFLPHPLIVCSVCGEPQHCRQLCGKHYAEFRALYRARRSRAKTK